VANEIRSMAENSKESSHEIRKIVEGIFQDNEAVIDSLSNSQVDINKGPEIINSTVDTFREMLSGVKEIFRDGEGNRQTEETDGLYFRPI